MSASTGTTSSAGVSTTPAFWERLWRTAGIQSLLCFMVAYIVYGHQPQVGASATHWQPSTTAIACGFWAPDGVYSRFVSPAIGLVWGMVVSGVLLTRSPATRAGW